MTFVQATTKWSAALLLPNNFLIIQFQSFKQAITKVSELFIHRVVLPDWILRLYATGREAKLAHEEIVVSMMTKLRIRH